MNYTPCIHVHKTFILVNPCCASCLKFVCTALSEDPQGMVTPLLPDLQLWLRSQNGRGAIKIFLVWSQGQEGLFLTVISVTEQHRVKEIAFVRHGHRGWSLLGPHTSVTGGHRGWSLLEPHTSVTGGHRGWSLLEPHTSVTCGHRGWSLLEPHTSVTGGHRGWSLLGPHTSVTGSHYSMERNGTVP